MTVQKFNPLLGNSVTYSKLYKARLLSKKYTEFHQHPHIKVTLHPHCQISLIKLKIESTGDKKHKQKGHQ